jgi:hypothetical protein
MVNREKHMKLALMGVRESLIAARNKYRCDSDSDDSVGGDSDCDDSDAAAEGAFGSGDSDSDDSVGGDSDCDDSDAADDSDAGAANGDEGAFGSGTTRDWGVADTLALVKNTLANANEGGKYADEYCCYSDSDDSDAAAADAGAADGDEGYSDSEDSDIAAADAGAADRVKDEGSPVWELTATRNTGGIAHVLVGSRYRSPMSGIQNPSGCGGLTGSSRRKQMSSCIY